MKKILTLEAHLTQVETWVLVASVLTMLVLATYNVAYRNVLVPIQAHLLSSGPPSVPTATPEEPAPTGGAPAVAPAPDATAQEPDVDGAGGFGGAPDEEGAGGFGGAPDEGEIKPAPEPDDAAGGFGGAPDEGEAKPAPEANPEPEAKPEPEPVDDGAGGFGGAPDDGEPKPVPEPVDDGAGGFGGAPDEATDKVSDEGAGGFGGAPDEGSDKGETDDAAGGFGGAPDESDAASANDEKMINGGEETPSPAPPTAPHVAVGGPPPEGSAAAAFVALVNWMKLGWIDVLLRQFVLITGFLGAMLATTRKKHINIDAVSRFLPAKGQRISAVVTNVVSAVICAILALAGSDLVAIGLEFPRELFSWAEEWVFQLVFPICFGLLSLHFLIRTAEAVVVVMEGGDEEKPPPKSSPPADAKANAGGES